MDIRPLVGSCHEPPGSQERQYAIRQFDVILHLLICPALDCTPPIEPCITPCISAFPGKQIARERRQESRLNMVGSKIMKKIAKSVMWQKNQSCFNYTLGEAIFCENRQVGCQSLVEMNIFKVFFYHCQLIKE